MFFRLRLRIYVGGRRWAAVYLSESVLMKKSLLLLASLLLTGLAHAQTGPAYTLHEWGTFTSVSGSDGVLLPGLQREEEGLPWFVESHAGMENLGNVPNNNDEGTVSTKGWRRPLKNVTIKMETPVIYFYTPQAFQAQVSVGFHGGSISQWYPPRSGGETLPGGKWNLPGGGIDFANGYKGSIQWNVRVTPPTENDSGQIFRGGETANWLHQRQPDSALVRTADGSVEKFLFYRGVGHFDLPVVTRMKQDGVLEIENRGANAVPSLLVFNMGRGLAQFRMLPPLGAGESCKVDMETLPFDSQWKPHVYDTLVNALVGAGLYRKEADAMLQTWWQSYFERPGLRVFWIVPRGFTDQLLPLAVQPAPQNAVRVLVGRSEVLTPAFEKSLLTSFQAKDNFLKSDRYFLAYQARVEKLGKTQTP